jgi:hypothetical protein
VLSFFCVFSSAEVSRRSFENRFQCDLAVLQNLKRALPFGKSSILNHQCGFQPRALVLQGAANELVVYENFCAIGVRRSSRSRGTKAQAAAGIWRNGDRCVIVRKGERLNRGWIRRCGRAHNPRKAPLAFASPWHHSHPSCSQNNAYALGTERNQNRIGLAALADALDFR